MSEGENSSSGFISSIAQSVKSHIDERMRSPFGGAFVLSWLIFNWKDLALLILSDSALERRLENFAALGWWGLLWGPLLGAIAVAGSFYLLSALFIVLVEISEALKRVIERQFDKVRWVSPSEYIEFKRGRDERLLYLQGIASDNLDVLDKERASTAAANEALIESQKLTVELRAQLDLKSADSAELVSRLSQVTQDFSSVSSKNSELISGNSIGYDLARQAKSGLDNVLDVNGGALTPVIRARLRSIADVMDEVCGKLLNARS